jgi:hypothetical protein
MCGMPDPPPPPAARQMEKTPNDLAPNGMANSLRQRRGFWATIMTSPQGAPGAPGVTGTPGV